jgi:hypothetical protein
LELADGGRLFVHPADGPIYEIARAKSNRWVAEIVESATSIEDFGGVVDGLPDLDDPDVLAGYSQSLFVQALACAAVIKWDGIGDECGRAVDVSEGAVRKLMRMPGVAEDFISKYTKEYADRVSEGNVSGVSQNGTSAEAPNIGKGAERKDLAVLVGG